MSIEEIAEMVKRLSEIKTHSDPVSAAEDIPWLIEQIENLIRTHELSIPFQGYWRN